MELVGSKVRPSFQLSGHYSEHVNHVISYFFLHFYQLMSFHSIMWDYIAPFTLGIIAHHVFPNVEICLVGIFPFHAVTNILLFAFDSF